MKKIPAAMLIAFSVILSIHSQDFTRQIQLETPRMHGEDIRTLQDWLMEHGFDQIGAVDGYYGPKTESAIKEVQEFLGVEANGRVHRELWNALFDYEGFYEGLLMVGIKRVNEIEKNRYDLTTTENIYGSSEGAVADVSWDGRKIMKIERTGGGSHTRTHTVFYNVGGGSSIILHKYYEQEGTLDEDSAIEWGEFLLQETDVYLMTMERFLKIEDFTFQETEDWFSPIIKNIVLDMPD